MSINNSVGESPSYLGAFLNIRNQDSVINQDNSSYYQKPNASLSQKTELEIFETIEELIQHFHRELPRHNQNVGNLAAKLAFQMGMSSNYVALISQAARLHDLGKIGISKTILLKPGTLTTEERELVSEHCQIGSDLLSGFNSELFNMAQSIAIAHHERWNGDGYPFQLTATTIPLEARIVAVADVFDALASQRPYGTIWQLEDIVALFTEKSGVHFDPAVVNALLTLLQHEASKQQFQTIQ